MAEFIEGFIFVPTKNPLNHVLTIQLPLMLPHRLSFSCTIRCYATSYNVYNVNNFIIES